VVSHTGGCAWCVRVREPDRTRAVRSAVHCHLPSPQVTNRCPYSYTTAATTVGSFGGYIYE
jgi:hypothetical protein